MKCVIFLIIFIFSVSCITDQCVAGTLPALNGQIKPSEISKMINQHGLTQTIELLYNNQNDWRMILQNIASGKREWLEIAMLLKPGTDAGASEMLNLSMGEAIENSPKLVLEIIKKGNIFATNDVCVSPDIDDSRYSTYDKAIITINHRIELLKKIDDRSIKDARDLCVKNLKESIPHLQKFFNKPVDGFEERKPTKQ